MDYESLFTFKIITLPLKDSSSIINKFIHKNRKCDGFELMKRASESLKCIRKKQYILECFTDRSVETYFYTLLSDNKSHYLIGKNTFKRFHNYKNAMKYMLSKSYIKDFKSEESIEYRCFDLDKLMCSSESTVAYAYTECKRINIVRI